MKTSSLAAVGAVCALLMVLGFIAGVPLMVAGGVDTLIPETGTEGLRWIADVEDASGAFFAGAWLTIFAALFGLVAYLGFYDLLRAAGPVMVVAPVAGVVAWTLVTVSHLIPISMAYELAPGYTEASGATQAALGVTFDTQASLALVTNLVGNVIGWGVVVPLFAYAILQTSLLPRWVGWLGLVVAFFGGWLGLLSPASSVIEGISSIGFVAFFVWMAAMGVVILRRLRSAAVVNPPVPTPG